MATDSTIQSDKGTYTLVAELGRGATAIVYEAVAPDGSNVALKLISSQLSSDESIQLRFDREVELLRNIEHPGIIRIFDSGRTETGSLFLSMERLEGDDLEGLSLSIELFVETVADVLDALGHAHDKGIVHRDLKPENIFLHHGKPKLIDFGIARDIEDSKSATKTGHTVGTPYYMSPEQALRPKAVAAASDLWSIGVMLYERLAGKLPFEGETVTSVLMQAASTPHVPLRVVNPEISQELSDLIDSCLEKEIGDRPQNAFNVAEMLRSLPLRQVNSEISMVHEEDLVATQTDVVADDMSLAATMADLSVPTKTDSSRKWLLPALALGLVGVGAFASFTRFEQPRTPKSVESPAAVAPTNQAVPIQAAPLKESSTPKADTVMENEADRVIQKVKQPKVRRLRRARPEKEREQDTKPPKPEHVAETKMASPNEFGPTSNVAPQTEEASNAAPPKPATMKPPKPAPAKTEPIREAAKPTQTKRVASMKPVTRRRVRKPQKAEEPGFIGF